MRRFSCMLLTVVMVISAVPFSPVFAGAVEEVGPYVGEPDPYIGDLGPYAELFEEPDVNVLSANATRAQVVTVLVGAVEQGLLSNPSTPDHRYRFHDVRINNWFYPPVAWAYQRGWARGDDKGRWHPNRSVERQEMFAMFVRAFNPPVSHPLPDLTTRFIDGHNVAGWAVRYLQIAVQQGWARGVPVGNGRYEIRAFAPTHINDPGWLVRNINPNLPVRFPYAHLIHRLTWDGNGGTSGGIWERVQGMAIGGPFPTSTRTSRSFMGWFTTSAWAGGAQLVPGHTLVGSGSVFARWYVPVGLVGRWPNDRTVTFEAHHSFSAAERGDMTTALSRLSNAMVRSNVRGALSPNTHSSTGFGGGHHPPVSDGRNRVYRESSDRHRESQGVAYVWFLTTNPINGFNRLVEADILINTRWTIVTNPSNNQNDNQFDFLTLFLHEAGHGFGLYHTNQRAAVMYPHLLPGERRRTLHNSDIRGLEALYGQR